LSSLEIFLIGFIASFLGTVTAFTAQYWLHKKQIEAMEKLKRSIKHQVKKLKEKEK